MFCGERRSCGTASDSQWRGRTDVDASSPATILKITHFYLPVIFHRLLEDTPKDVYPVYLVSMPGEVKDRT